jgi:hypothetical protein
MVSEAKMATVKTKMEAGLDAVFDFEVVGHLPTTRPATAGAR